MNPLTQILDRFEPVCVAYRNARAVASLLANGCIEHVTVSDYLFAAESLYMSISEAENGVQEAEAAIVASGCTPMYEPAEKHLCRCRTSQYHARGIAALLAYGQSETAPQCDIRDAARLIHDLLADAEQHAGEAARAVQVLSASPAARSGETVSRA